MPARDRLSWFRWNPRDHVGDPAVQAMTDEQLGKYTRVLTNMYLQNSGKAREGDIMVWARCSPSEWLEHKGALARAFKIHGTTWTQKRVKQEVRAAKERVKKASASGRLGASRRWGSMTSLRRRDSSDMAAS